VATVRSSELEAGSWLALSKESDTYLRKEPNGLKRWRMHRRKMGRQGDDLSGEGVRVAVCVVGYAPPATSALLQSRVWPRPARSGPMPERAGPVCGDRTRRGPPGDFVSFTDPLVSPPATCRAVGTRNSLDWHDFSLQARSVGAKASKLSYVV
jgi:hypothetical protein